MGHLVVGSQIAPGDSDPSAAAGSSRRGAGWDPWAGVGLGARSGQGKVNAGGESSPSIQPSWIPLALLSSSSSHVAVAWIYTRATKNANRRLVCPGTDTASELLGMKVGSVLLGTLLGGK